MPQNPNALCDLGLALKQSGDLAAAIIILRSALTIKPDFERANYALGIALQMQGQQADAASKMRVIRDLHQSRVELAQSKKLILDGIALMNAKKFQEAKSELPESYFYL